MFLPEPQSSHRWPVAGLFVLALTVALVYTSGLNTSFHSDDYGIIKLNPEIQNPSNFLGFLPPRYRQVLHLSFAWNYVTGGFDPVGYHVFNIVIHMLTTLLVFLVIQITARYGMHWEWGRAGMAALLGSALFGLHPVHTEAVTYISGRSSGLSAFFCLFTLMLFIAGNLKHVPSLRRAFLQGVALIMIPLALLSKETSAVLPLALLLYDRCFMQSEAWDPFAHRFRSFYGPGVILVLMILVLSPSLRAQGELFLTRMDLGHALTQIPVVAYALKLYLFPINLTFDYDFTDQFFGAWNRGMSFLLLMLLGYFAIKNAFRKPAWMTFGLTWFALTLFPTNGVFPRMDWLSERNLYLPGFGLCFLAGVTLSMLIQSLRHSEHLSSYPVCAATMGCLILFSVGIVHRSDAYRTDVTLWQDTLRKSPQKAEVQYYLSMAYSQAGDYEKSYQELGRLSRSHPELLAQLSGPGISTPQAIRKYQQLLADLSRMLDSQTEGTQVYREIYNELQSLASPQPALYYTRIILAQSHARQGNLTLAKRDFAKAIEVRPDRPEAHLNLGILFAGQGRFREALESLHRAERAASPEASIYADILLNLAKVNYDLGELGKAQSRLGQYLKIRSPNPETDRLTSRIDDLKSRTGDRAS